MASPSDHQLTPDDIDALEKIRRIQDNDQIPHWSRPDQFAYQYAYKLATLAPAEALKMAEHFIEDLRKHNLEEMAKFEAAKEVQAELAEHPITNAGERGLIGYLKRQFLATLNATPFSRLDWFEVNAGGLQIFQPFATVSQRTIKYRDILNGTVVLSVNPPAYMDRFLGLARQFSRNVEAPWGEIVVYEPGSGRTIGSAVAWQPAKKVRQMRHALEQLHRVENPYANFQRVPKLEDFLVYYDLDRWEGAIPDEPKTRDNSTGNQDYTDLSQIAQG